VDPTVIAAVVGVGGTVVVGIAGYAANVWSTNKTIAHDRESKIWDQRAAVYVEALAALHYRQVARNATISQDDENRRIAEGLLSSYQQPDWHKLEACMQAFASEPVVTLMQASSNAHMDAMAAYYSWNGVIIVVGRGNSASAKAVEAQQAAEKLKDALDTAQITAEKADDAVVEAIRIELQGRGKPLGDWQPINQMDASP
jgi:hypothetical protein